MGTRHNAFGRGCFLVGLAVLYLLLGIKLFFVWRDGLWPGWPLGDFMPDPVVRAVFAIAVQPVRSVMVWVLSRDVVSVVAAVCLVLWLLDLPGDAEADDEGRSGSVSR